MNAMESFAYFRRVFGGNAEFWKHLFTQYQRIALGLSPPWKVNIHFVSIIRFLSNIFPQRVNFEHGRAFVSRFQIYI